MASATSRRPVDVIDRRVGVLFGLFLLALVLGLVRAGYLGVFRSSALSAAAATEHIDNQTIPAVRGTITDRNGVVFALSQPVDTVIADPLIIRANPQAMAARIAPLLKLSKSTVIDDLTKPNTGYVKIKADVPETTAQRIQKMGYNGLSLTPGEEQVYPRGSSLGQVLGWAGSKRKNSGGLEYLLWKQLAGQTGHRRVVTAQTGQAISVQTTKPMVQGKTVQLTVSAPLQNEVEQVLSQVGEEYHPKGATAIVTDPQTNQVLAIANWPSFNPNDAITAANESDTEDQAVGFSYEPGSTFKAITVAGALQDGLVTPDTVFTVPPDLEAYGKTVSDAESHGYVNYTVEQILKYSSNIGADLIGRDLGADRFAGWVNKFGFGKPTGVDLSGEQGGIVPPVDDYNGLSMLNLPFGQGQSVTPMQMVQAYDAIADGGVLRTPQVIESIGGEQQKAARGKRIISGKVASELRDMLRGVLADGGTASGAAIPGYDLAGKTGTAEVAVDGKYSATDFVASFIGMVPASDPKLVVAVVVNDPKSDIYGGTVAAPAFQQIVGWAVPYFGINPCPDPCPTSAMDPATPSTP
jgi:cell division protein FtsI (penicillin-binding protein 3)